MNVFVLNTGRCGSTTFIKACHNISNYTSGHESRTALLGDDRLEYPLNHIEADNRLSWLLGRLDKIYGTDAFYVHLKRNIYDTAKSFTKRYSSGIMKAYREKGIILNLLKNSDPMAVAMDYCNTINGIIELFLKDKPKKFLMDLENIESDFVSFWKLIQAQGNLNNALNEFKTHHNASEHTIDKSSQKQSSG